MSHVIDSNMSTNEVLKTLENYHIGLLNILYTIADSFLNNSSFS